MLTPAEKTAVASLTGEGQKDLQALITGAEEFLTGQPVSVVIGIPTEKLSFTAKNPFGVLYNFTLAEQNGKVVLKGTVA